MHRDDSPATHCRHFLALKYCQVVLIDSGSGWQGVIAKSLLNIMYLARRETSACLG